MNPASNDNRTNRHASHIGRSTLIALTAAASLAAVCLEGSLRAEEKPAPGKKSPLFETDIRPIFQKHCVGCHGTKQKKADLDLSSHRGLLAGGESGPAIEPGKQDAESLLLEMVLDGSMPPEGKKRLAPQEIALIRAWFEAGSPFAKALPTEPTITQHDVIPILLRRCMMCHGPEYQEGGVDLRTRQAMLKGGASGPSLVPGKPDDSPMVKRITTAACPPKAALGEAGIEPTTDDELEILKQWIALGAPQSETIQDPTDLAADPLVSDKDRQFWSFQPPQQTTPPKVKHADLVRNPIDAFLLEKLEAAGLSYSPPADSTTLLRRATFALTGLPPSPEEAEQWAKENDPQAYEQLIKRLLASPRYGERWGRMWLDLAGYADSEGKRSADMIRPYAWKYRDYVIASFNADKPYNVFLTEQLAGDELVDWRRSEVLPSEELEKVIATGFLRMAPDGTSADPVNRVIDRMEVIADELDVLGRGVMGLTLKCARCHSHKYDPIPQRDYYRLVAVFKGAYDEYDWLTPQPFGNQWVKAKRRHLPLMTPQEDRQWQAKKQEIEGKIKKLQAEAKQKQADKKRKAAIAKQVRSLQDQLKNQPKIRALWDRGRPSPTYLYRRGDPTMPGQLMSPGVPAALSNEKAPFQVEPPNSQSTGRRLALARWLTQPDHPLTARVIVNRVWKHHFGAGIVKTLDDFGRLGATPSHQELLDYLAVDFVKHGWSIKRLHHMIMTSTAYRQASIVRSQPMKVDSENRLLWRMPMRRLEAEEVRDTILACADKLNLKPFGPPDQVDVRNDGLVTSKATDGRWRRSIYVRHRRKEMPTILETFDLPQMNPNCIQRINSTVVSQPLHLLNNKAIHSLAGQMAQRIRIRAGDDVDAQIRLAFLIAVSRSPDADQQRLARQAIADLNKHWQAQPTKDKTNPDEKALADFCHALINSAEFLYID